MGAFCFMAGQPDSRLEELALETSLCYFGKVCRTLTMRHLHGQAVVVLPLQRRAKLLCNSYDQWFCLFGNAAEDKLAGFHGFVVARAQMHESSARKPCPSDIGGFGKEAREPEHLPYSCDV